MDRLKTGFDGLTWSITSGNKKTKKSIACPGISLVAMSHIDTFIPVYQKLMAQGGGILDRMLIHHGVPHRMESKPEKRRKIQRAKEFNVHDFR